MKQLTNRVQKLSVGVIAAIFVAAFFVSVIPAESVFAAKVPANDSSTNPDDWLPKTRATRWAHLTGLYHCVQSAWSGGNDWADWNNWLEQNHNKISDAHAASGEWFWDPTGPKDRDNEAASYIDIQTKDNGSGKADCNLVAQAAMKTYSMSGAELLCKLGAKREDGSDCTNSGTKATFDPPSSGARMDVSSVWGSKDLPSNAGGTAYYELNLAALMSSKGCNLQEKAGATGNFAYTLKVLDSSGKLVDKTYTGQSRDHKINVYTSYPGINNQERSCGTIAGDLNKYSGDYAQWYNDHEADTTSTNGTDGTGGTAEPTTCAVDGIGWIVCPVMNLMAKVNDSAFGFLTQFLTIRPALLTNDGTQNAWSAFRDIANVAFVIAFLVIVYSQLTSAGVSNYGIKKMLPRIVVAAILVNVSYYVCELAVDVSNIVGSSIYSLLKESINIGGNISNATWESKTVGILAGAGAVGGIVLLALLVIMAPTSLLAFVVIILILVARQAFVILLVVMSPLAFVAYLLPNTESWFKKWWKSFMAVLMVYPIVGVVFGASTLASNILSSAAANTNDASILQLIALGVLAVPLFAVPALLKGSLSAAGNIGTKLAGLQDRATSRGIRGIKEGRIGEAKGAFDARRQQRKVEQRLGKRRYFGVVPSGFNKTLDSGAIGKYTGGDRGAAAATAAYHKAAHEEVERQGALMSNDDADSLLAIAMDKKSSAERRAAALQRVTVVGGHQHVQKAFDYLDEAGARGDDKDIEDIQQLSADALLKRKPSGVRTSEANKLKEGKLGEGKSVADAGYYNMFASRVKEGAFGTGDYAKMDKDDLIRLSEMSQSGKIDGASLKGIFDEIAKDETLKGTLTPERQALYDSIVAKSGPVRADGSTRQRYDASGAPVGSSGGLVDLKS